MSIFQVKALMMEEEDVVMITRDGMKVAARSKILGIHSTILASLIGNNRRDDGLVFSVDATSDEVSALVTLMQGGEVVLKSKKLVEQVVLLAKSLAVDLGNFLSLYSLQRNPENEDKILYRETDKKTSNNRKPRFGHKIPESNVVEHQENLNFENLLKEDDNEDSGVYEEIDLSREEVLTSFEKSSKIDETFSRDEIKTDFEGGRESKMTSKSLSCTKIAQKTDSKSTKILRSATLPKKIGKGARNLSSELEQIEEQQGDAIKCNSCPKTFKTSSKLKMHMMCHTSFSCNSCDKGFRFASLLNNHMERCEEELQYKKDLKSQSLLFQNKMKRLSLNNANVENLSSLV